MGMTHDRFNYLNDADILELSTREVWWLMAENMYGSGAWEEPGERLPN